ncbi:MAG: hypothetical protein U0637_08575 [Phycisphaerales bacterium]
MPRPATSLGLFLLASIAGSAVAQPTITSLGTGLPAGVSDPVSGIYYISGGSGSATLWTLNGASLSATSLGGNSGGRIAADGSALIGTALHSPQSILGATATGVSPAFSTSPTLVTSLLAATESYARRWNGTSWQSLGGLPGTTAATLADTQARSLLVFGSGSSGSSSGTFMSPNSISANGQFVVGQGYISTYNTAAGTAISNNSFMWRAWVYDSSTGITRVLPTPFRTSSNTYRRRTGNAYAVSNDGQVIVGAQEHNVGTTPTADPDGGRLVVWRWNAGTNTYDMSYLPNGVNGSGFPIPYSTTPGVVQMNATGTLIVGPAVDNNSSGYIGKWVWNAGTSSWDAPVSIGSNLTVPATWLPAAVTNCGVPAQLTVTGMSNDGNTVVGIARYSTCGSFMSGGFIWTSATNQIQDWYDYCVSIGVPNVTQDYGPIGDLGDPSRGLPKLGFPSAISPNGNAVAGFQGGNQLIPGAVPWVLLFTGGPTCVAPTVTTNPTTPTNFSACTSSIILNAGASGTAPLSYQWYKNGVQLQDGLQPTGSNVTGAGTFQLRVNPPLSVADAGSYYAVISSECAPSVQTNSATVQVDPAFPAATNDVCSGASTVVQGTNVLGAGESPCGAFVDDFFGTASCAPNGTSKSDRWYTFTPTTTNNFRIETCGANYDTVVTVYASCSSSELACSNDYTTGPTTGCTSTRSRIPSLAMTSGTPYLIRVAAPTAAFLSSTSLLNLSINPAPAPAANDSCSAATAAIVGANPFDLTEATNDGFSSCNTALSRDVWFSYTQESTGKVKFSTCGTTLNTVMSVSDGCGGVELACNDNSNLTGCTSQAVIDNFNVTGHTTYIIRVAGNSTTAVGSGNLTITQIGCDSIDYNNDGLFPDTADIDDFLSVFSGGACSTGACGDIDFNNDGLFPDTADIDSLLSVFSGGACL